MNDFYYMGDGLIAQMNDLKNLTAYKTGCTNNRIQQFNKCYNYRWNEY